MAELKTWSNYKFVKVHSIEQPHEFWSKIAYENEFEIFFSFFFLKIKQESRISIKEKENKKKKGNKKLLE